MTNQKSVSEQKGAGHTALPWTLCDETDSYRQTISICGPRTSTANKVAVLFARNMTESGASQNCEVDKTKANAAFIVVAVNSHDRLLAERAELVAALEAISQSWPEHDSRTQNAMADAMAARANAALSKL